MTVHKHLGIVFLILVGYFTIIFFTPKLSDSFTLCPIKNLSGIDCPSCHLGKASTLLFSGNLSKAMKSHSLVLPINFLVIIYCSMVIYSFIMKRSKPISFLDRSLSNRKLLSVSGSVLIINWIISLF
jgi:hypothetical protein